MTRYKKKPVVINAIQYTRDNVHEIMNFIEKHSKEDNSRYLTYDTNKNEYYITTLEGQYLLTKGDYVICGVKGEFYPCKPGIFEMTYEKVKED